MKETFIDEVERQAYAAKHDLVPLPDTIADFGEFFQARRARIGERQESCRLMFTQQSLRRRGADAVRSGGAKCSSAPCSSTTKLRCGAPTSPELGSTRGWG